MNYEPSYLWPPRPKTAVPASMLGFYDRQGWWAQIKKNGSCSVIFLHPDGPWHVMGREENEHKRWDPQTSNARIFFESIERDGWVVLAAELLDSKTPHIKDTLYVFDILVHNSKYLIGTTFAERQVMLLQMFGVNYDQTHSHYGLHPNAWLAKTYTPNDLSGRGLVELYGSLGLDEDEGIVIKDPRGVLELCSRNNRNGGWQVKCRKLHKNYGF